VRRQRVKNARVPSGLFRGANENLVDGHTTVATNDVRDGVGDVRHAREEEARQPRRWPVNNGQQTEL
jgi:hypothetical protein